MAEDGGRWLERHAALMATMVRLQAAVDESRRQMAQLRDNMAVLDLALGPHDREETPERPAAARRVA
jgi:hypothetical protein